MGICSPLHFQPPRRPLPGRLLLVTEQPQLIRLSARDTGRCAKVSQNDLWGLSCFKPRNTAPAGLWVPPRRKESRAVLSLFHEQNLVSGCSSQGAKHGLTPAHGLTRRLPPWSSGRRTRCRMGQTRSAGRNRLPRGRRAAESARGKIRVTEPSTPSLPEALGRARVDPKGFEPHATNPWTLMGAVPQGHCTAKGQGDRWWPAPRGLSQGWGRARTAPVPTHLPASIPVGQEPESYAEDHVAKKHHLQGIGRQLWGDRSQQHQAALFSKMEVS